MSDKTAIDIESLEDYLKGLNDDTLTAFANGHRVIEWIAQEYDLNLSIDKHNLDDDEVEHSSGSDSE